MATRLIRNSLLFFFSLFASLSGAYYEGVEIFFKDYGKVDLHWIPQFLPYNPVIIEAGAFQGDETCRASKLWPEGRIIAFEPNPEAFDVLQKKVQKELATNVELYNLALNDYNGIACLNVCHGMQGVDSVFGYASSLLPLTQEMQIYCKGPQFIVSCVNFDDWCKKHQIDHIDLLKLELEGLELHVLRSSPQILQNTKVLFIKTQMHPHRVGMTQYNELKAFLEQSGFVLLSHWYDPGIIGHAIFLSREIFDAYLKLSLGLYLEL
jgi:FkbM family methyltransferase